jgi:hypothetical protein
MSFFIVGSGRCGTSLLKVMLEGHSRICLPPAETQAMPYFVNRYGRHNPLSIDIDEFLGLPGVKAMGVDRAEISARLNGEGKAPLAEVFRAAFDAYTDARGKTIWGEKTPTNVLYMDLIADMFPDARFIHMIRDGREVAASLAEMPWGPSTPVKGAFRWVELVSGGRRYGADLTDSRYMEIKLERLVLNPTEELRRACSFLGVPYEPQMHNYVERVKLRRESAKGPKKGVADATQHLDKEPTTGLRDWTRGLSSFEQWAIEATCRPLLAQLDYPVKHSSPLITNLEGAFRTAYRGARRLRRYAYRLGKKTRSL